MITSLSYATTFLSYVKACKIKQNTIKWCKLEVILLKITLV